MLSFGVLCTDDVSLWGLQQDRQRAVAQADLQPPWTHFMVDIEDVQAVESKSRSGWTALPPEAEGLHVLVPNHSIRRSWRGSI